MSDQYRNLPTVIIRKIKTRILTAGDSFTKTLEERRGEERRSESFLEAHLTAKASLSSVEGMERERAKEMKGDIENGQGRRRPSTPAKQQPSRSAAISSSTRTSEDDDSFWNIILSLLLLLVSLMLYNEVVRHYNHRQQQYWDDHYLKAVRSDR